jgi:acyl carrier protein
VAVIGVGVRLPGGISSLDDLWPVLAEGRDLVTEVPGDRFSAARFHDPMRNRAGKSYTVAGGFLNEVAGFDAGYFGISPKEASRVDPQHRLLLECAVEAFDDGGIDPAALAGSDTAVFMGLSSHDYADLQERRPRTYTAYNMAGGASCNAANRVSYFFDLPALAAPRTAGLLPARDDAQPAQDLRQAIAGCTTQSAALALIDEALATLLATVMQTSPERIAHDRRLDLLGVDSLMATDITSRIREIFGCDIPALEITGTDDLTALARRIRREMTRPATQESR